MKKAKARIIFVMAGVTAAVMSLVCFSLTALAATPTSLVKKAALTGMYACYNAGAYKDNFAQSDYKNAKWLVSNAKAYTTYFPNDTTGLKNNKGDCNEILNGKAKSFDGLYALYSITTPTNVSPPDDTAKFLNGMGYDSETGANGKCIRAVYARNIDGKDSGGETITLCADKVNGGKIGVDKMSVSYQRISGSGITNTGSSEAIRIKVSSGAVTCQVAGVRPILGTLKWNDVATIQFKNGSTSWDDFQKSFLENGCAPNKISYVMANSSFVYNRSEVTYPDAGQIMTQFTLADDGADRAIKFLSGMSYDDLKLSPEEKITLLQYYLDDYYKIEKRCGLTNADEIAMAKGDGFELAEIMDGNDAKLCYIKPTAHIEDAAYIWDSNDYLGNNSFAFFGGIKELMNRELKEYLKVDCEAQKGEFLQKQLAAASTQYNHAPDENAKKKAKEYLDKYANWQFWEEKDDGTIICREIEAFVPGTTGSPETQPKPPEKDTEDNNNGGDSSYDDCTGAAGSLGWILCPVLNMVSRGVDSIYQGYVQKQFLEIDKDAVVSNSKVYGAWQLIRNIANIIFVIFFLIVLFSQLTGLGLSNYGIKKMLPRLIVVVVLVNISFFFCQLAVDLSNILGYGLNGMFNSLGGEVNDLSSTFNEPGGAGGLASWVSVLGRAITAGTAGSWLSMLLLTLLSAAISVFFGAIVLAARQAGIFILIVLAPVAIVCYALPNMKKFFDRWIKTLLALLMVFPICGALVGGGNFAASIIIGSSENFFLVLVGMLLRVVPFFLIPGLVKSSLSALGNVGAKIGNIGNRLSGNATGAVRKSAGFQRFSEQMGEARGRGIALRHRMLSAVTGGRYTGSTASKRRLARYIGTQEARMRGDARANAIAAGGFISQGRRQDLAAAAEEKEETQGIAEAASSIKASMDAGDADAMGSELERNLEQLKSDPTNIEVRRRVKALTKILLESDPGRGKLAKVTQQFAETNPDNDATKILGKYLGNSENMGTIKGHNQRGLQKLVEDINKGNTIRSAMQYASLGANKIGAGAVGNLDESFLQAQVEAANDGTMSTDDLNKFADTYTRALTSENAANEIPPEIANLVNQVREAAYMRANNNSSVGFQELRPGDTLPIPKAKTPNGWHYDDTTQQWLDGHGAALSHEDALKAEEIAKHNAKRKIDYE